jgi:Smg protein
MTARVLEMVSLFLKRSLEENLDSEAKQDLADSLVEDGHNPNEVHAALSIVDRIQQHLESPGTAVAVPRTNRLFMILEEMHLSPEIRGYLTQLMSLDVIDPLQREELVERLLMMDPDDLSLDDVESVLEEVLASKPKILGQFDETISDYYH